MNRPTAYKVTLERWQSRGGSRGGTQEGEVRSGYGSGGSREEDAEMKEDRKDVRIHEL